MGNLVLLSTFMSLAAFTLAQQKLDDQARWLFPADKDLLSAGQVGFQLRTTFRFDQSMKAGASLTLSDKLP